MITYDTLAACTSPPAPALLYSLPAPRGTSACAAASSNPSHRSRCSRSTRTRESACRGSYLHTTHVSIGLFAGWHPAHLLNLALFSRFDAEEVPERFLITTTVVYLRHSGIMHFSTSSTSAPQIDPSAGGIFTKRSLLFMPRPQVALQTSHSPHSVTRQLLGAEPAKQSQDSVIVHLCTHLLRSDAEAKQENSQHSSLTTQSSVSSVGSVQMEPSSGNCFT